MNAQVKSAGSSPALLGLRSILVTTLPSELMTANAPDRYTVEAVFTRRVEPDEIAAIEGNETRAQLSAHGYSTAELRVSDRRLEIHNTNLEELRDGLASVIAQRLGDIDTHLAIQRNADAHRFQDASHQEKARAAAVAVLAESIAFTPPDAGDLSDESARVSDWMEEGGSGRD
ncbi:hypothetical protein QE428_000892 [Microbacterium sp. SORGH_AS 505]|uniref:hypothetical protein n=1 Tax=Microbacterium sp. SORGH_AS_0505 TaxID=3041770 RepID=UPI00278AE5BE|nr:hypothetical protein [Microbacterium sp. SORGH_AS_0505]MDQ1125859.1 hypothetical protein [Microbacterium sp. SORGH_AS_0505]